MPKDWVERVASCVPGLAQRAVGLGTQAEVTAEIWAEIASGVQSMAEQLIRLVGEQGDRKGAPGADPLEVHLQMVQSALEQAAKEITATSEPLG